MSARGIRPSSAASRAADADRLSPAATCQKQQNGLVAVGHQPAAGLADSVGGFRGALLYVLGEKSQMKVPYCVIILLMVVIFYCQF